MMGCKFSHKPTAHACSIVVDLHASMCAAGITRLALRSSMTATRLAGETYMRLFPSCGHLILDDPLVGAGAGFREQSSSCGQKAKELRLDWGAPVCLLIVFYLRFVSICQFSDAMFPFPRESTGMHLGGHCRGQSSPAVRKHGTNPLMAGRTAGQGGLAAPRASTIP